MWLMLVCIIMLLSEFHITTECMNCAITMHFNFGDSRLNTIAKPHSYTIFPAISNAYSLHDVQCSHKNVNKNWLHLNEAENYNLNVSLGHGLREWKKFTITSFRSKYEILQLRESWKILKCLRFYSWQSHINQIAVVAINVNFIFCVDLPSLVVWIKLFSAIKLNILIFPRTDVYSLTPELYINTNYS